MTDTRVTLCAIFRVPAEGVAAFQAYEDAVLPLLAEHGGRLERRLRTADGRTEVHIVSFENDAVLGAYRADPRRAALAGMLGSSGANVETMSVVDVRSG